MVIEQGASENGGASSLSSDVLLMKHISTLSSLVFLRQVPACHCSYLSDYILTDLILFVRLGLIVIRGIQTGEDNCHKNL